MIATPGQWSAPTLPAVPAVPGQQWPMAAQPAGSSTVRPGATNSVPPQLIPLQLIPPRSARVPVPSGLLAATAAAGCAGAILVPVDRPGVGWLLAGLVITGAVYAVDRSARRTVPSEHGVVSAARDADAAVAAASGTVPAAQPSSALAAPPTSSTATRRPVDVGSGASSVGGPGGPEDGAGTGSAGRPRPGGSGRTGGVSWDRIWWVGVALALLGVGVFRAAPWLFVLCVLGAALAGSLAVVRRSVYGLWFDLPAVAFAGLNSPPWLYRAMTGARGRFGKGSQRVWWSVAVAAALLVMVVPLLAGADAVFAGLVDGLMPRIDVPAAVRWGLVFVVVGLGTAGALYLLAGPPPVADDAGPGRGLDPVGWLGVRRFSPIEWGIPVGALTIVFAAFVGTQVVVLFGGDGYVQRTAGLTYAEYARSGFWQLSIVSMLTLAVIGTVLRHALQDTVIERRWLRGAITVVIGLSLVIVASGLHRMWTYQQAYGFTVMRLLVEVFEAWIALVYLLLLASLVRLRRGWVPRAAVGAALATVLALAVANPERFIAQRNVERWQAGKSLDTGYLSTLSPDVLPVADRLPDAERAAIADIIRARLSGDSWQGWNYARATAHR
ncbi:DUF4153 domain-containing protein [Nocardia sp. NPDC059228]|uniref:DUF4153 domain-containing protein n=1 Tax=Nocardia sp. NPDC059228 TaxID=3346777 RepID=UPI0036B65977